MEIPTDAENTVEPAMRYIEVKGLVIGELVSCQRNEISQDHLDKAVSGWLLESIGAFQCCREPFGQ